MADLIKLKDSPSDVSYDKFIDDIAERIWRKITPVFKDQMIVVPASTTMAESDPAEVSAVEATVPEIHEEPIHEEPIEHRAGLPVFKTTVGYCSVSEMGKFLGVKCEDLIKCYFADIFPKEYVILGKACKSKYTKYDSYTLYIKRAYAQNFNFKAALLSPAYKDVISIAEAAKFYGTSVGDFSKLAKRHKLYDHFSSKFFNSRRFFSRAEVVDIIYKKTSRRREKTKNA